LLTRLPLASKLLRFCNLRGSHFGRERIASFK
jgi:hypothetical protein